MLNMMNDYCARESTRCEGEEVCVSQMSTSEILKETRQELTETISILRGISFSLNGKEINEKKNEEPKCLYEEANAIRIMTLDCMELAHLIMDTLFGIKR